MSMLPPVEYQQQIAKLRMAELARSSRHPVMRSKFGTRRALARGLRRLADWIEPALAMRVPVQRRAA